MQSSNKSIVTSNGFFSNKILLFILITLFILSVSIDINSLNSFLINPIFLVFYFPIFLFIIICFIPKHRIFFIKKVSFVGTFFLFLFSLFYFIFYNFSLFNLSWFDFRFYSENMIYFFNINYILGFDGLSIVLILLTTILFPICVLINSNSVNYRYKEYILFLIMLEIFLLNTFSSLNILFFYIFFEAVLFPMFFIIGIWGSRQRKVHAAYQFFLYTFFGSVFMLISILVIYLHLGTLSYDLLILDNFDFLYQKFLWICIFFSLAIKIPMIPLHIWLPEAHVEAPTAGSVLLAGILLKLGSYGILRFLLPLFPLGTVYYTPFVYIFCILGIVYGSLTTLRQIDMKKIIAYSSVVHMNFALLGLFSFVIEGLQGSIFLMLSHGVISGALFFCIGCLYDRYHTRLLSYYNGLVNVMPIFSLIFLIFILGNISFPGTSNFVGEFLVFLGIFQTNTFIGALSSLGVVLSATYSIWMYNRIIFKNLLLNYLNYFRDIKKIERFNLYPLIFLVFFMGIYPKLFLDITYIPCLRILNFI